MIAYVENGSYFDSNKSKITKTVLFLKKLSITISIKSYFFIYIMKNWSILALKLLKC